MPAYKYEKFRSPLSQIRVLTLENGSGDDFLRGFLSNTKLADPPVFEALSYTWGSPQKPYSIQIRYESSYLPLTITENLHNALHRLRSPTRERHIWIDAICINQDDEAEKSHQIRLMRDVYSSAEAVLIYLGEQDDDSSKAFDVMDRIFKAVRETPALKDFFRRPYFRRKWIIQEVAVSSNAVVICGNWQRGWDWFEVIGNAVYKYGLAVIDHTTYIDPMMSAELQQGLAQMRELIRTKNSWKHGTKFNLTDLLYRFQTARATNRRDHVFALLGLAADDPNLNLDYKVSVADVVENYARFLLEQKRNLEVLYLAGLQGHRLLAPSWIPNWYGTHKGFTFEYAEGPWSYSRRRNLPGFYNAAPGASMEIVESGSRVLGLRGCRIDRISKLANKYVKGSSQTAVTKDSELQRVRQHAAESDAIMNTLSSYPTGEDLAEVHWRTLICNVTFELTKAPGDSVQCYQAWRRTQRFPPLALGSPEWQLQNPFSDVIGSYNSDKFFGKTENGYVGMFPMSSETDDEIYLLFGGDFPFVLRPAGQNGHFKLVGQCYIHGIMEGQIDWTSCTSEVVYLGGTYEVADDTADEG